MVKDNVERLMLPRDGALPERIKNYFTMISMIDMKSLCIPLNEIGINYFLYVKRENDCYLHLTNLPEWLSYFMNNKYYLECFFHDPLKKYLSGSYLWQGLYSQQKIYNDLRVIFGIDHGITVIKTYQDCDEFFYFGTTKENHVMINYYLNHLYELQKFILYFKDNFTKNENKLKKRVVVPTREIKDIETERISLNISFQRYYVGGLQSDTYLTCREAECLKWYLQGKNIPEVAQILDMSPRTVETHIARVKNKTNCFSRSQLYSAFSQLFKE